MKWSLLRTDFRCLIHRQFQKIRLNNILDIIIYFEDQKHKNEYNQFSDINLFRKSHLISVQQAYLDFCS